mmetsp:Transcript_4456/g.12990  ORF Transcript_4456/g.12990 Transcript_4456/m.12990 type:complete len:431 (+) Transcript_4456:633-1925(+)
MPGLDVCGHVVHAESLLAGVPVDAELIALVHARRHSGRDEVPPVWSPLAVHRERRAKGADGLLLAPVEEVKVTRQRAEAAHCDEAAEGIPLEGVAPRDSQGRGELARLAVVECHRGRQHPDDHHELVGARRPAQVLDLAVLGAVDLGLLGLAALGGQPVEVRGAEVRRAGLIHVATGKRQERCALTVPQHPAVFHLGRQVQLRDRLGDVGQVVHGDACRHAAAALGDVAGNVAGTLVLCRCRHVVRDVLLRYHPRRGLALLVLLQLADVALAHRDALAGYEHEAEGLVEGPRDHLHGQGPAGIPLQDAGVALLASAVAGQRPAVHVVGVLRVPLLVGDHEVALGRELQRADAAGAATDVRRDLGQHADLLVALDCVVDAHALIADGCQQGPIRAPSVAKGVWRRRQCGNHLHAYAFRAMARSPVCRLVLL